MDPIANFTDTYYVTKGGEKLVSQGVDGDESTDLLPTPSRTNSMYGSLASSVTSLKRSSFLEKSIRYTFGRFSDGNSLRLFHFMVDDEKPSDHHYLYDIEINNVSTCLSSLYTPALKSLIERLAISFERLCRAFSGNAVFSITKVNSLLMGGIFVGLP